MLPFSSYVPSPFVLSCLSPESRSVVVDRAASRTVLSSGSGHHPYDAQPCFHAHPFIPSFLHSLDGLQMINHVDHVAISAGMITLSWGVLS